MNGNIIYVIKLKDEDMVVIHSLKIVKKKWPKK